MANKNGIVLIGCVQQRIKVQNDLRDWFLDKDNKPIKVVNEKYWDQQGVSNDPKDIPPQKVPNPKDGDWSHLKPKEDKIKDRG